MYLNNSNAIVSALVSNIFISINFELNYKFGKDIDKCTDVSSTSKQNTANYHHKGHLRYYSLAL